jgi:KipI family sensor histidine kinase inhibitor
MGDRALLVELGDAIDRDLNLRVRTLYYNLSREDFEGVVELLPSYAALMIRVDPLHISLSALKIRIRELMERADSARIPEPKTVEIPVVYGYEYGPDLEWVAGFHGLQPDDVVRYHSHTTYYVYMLGFTPGYPYMGELPDELVTPRRDTPRTRVPQGSVGIAQKQTGVYPVESPGGWQIIGRTPITLFDPNRQPPTPLEMGDTVKFIPITKEAYEDWQP